MKRKLKLSSRVWKHNCKGGEICCICGLIAYPDEERIWVSGMDQDDLFCMDCVEVEK